ncbi:hypothetical protein K8I28_08885 [bacterium]|nr:hypothetical protein [bacterium]
MTFWVNLTGALLGSVGGYLYYALVGCTTNSCAIWSNPFIATFYGALLGGLLFSLLPIQKLKKSEDTQVS